MGNYLTYTEGSTNDLEPYIADKALNGLLVDIVDADDRTAAVNEAIDAAESEVDASIATRYTVPLTSPTAFVIQLAGILTVEGLYFRTGRGVPEALRPRIDAARRSLAMIAAGKIKIEGATSASTSSGIVQVSAEYRELTRDDLGFW